MTEDAAHQQDEDSMASQPGSLADNMSMSRPDYALEEFQGLANATGVGFGVTLIVNGVVVSGNVISGQRFFQLTAERMRGAEVLRTDPPGDAAAPGVPERLAEMFESFEGFYPDLGEGVEREKAPFVPPRYVHLDDARVVLPGGGRIEVAQWRGRLSHVSGWSLGYID